MLLLSDTNTFKWLIHNKIDCLRQGRKSRIFLFPKKEKRLGRVCQDKNKSLCAKLVERLPFKVTVIALIVGLACPPWVQYVCV